MSAGDAMERAHDAVVARIGERLAELGRDDATGGMMPGGLNPDYGTSGNLLLYRTRTRDGSTVTGPDYIGVLDREPWIDRGDLEAIDRHVYRHVRRAMRRKAIEAAGTPADGRDPPWSHTMHRLARAALLEAGIDPWMLARPGSDVADGLKHGRVLGILADQHGVELGGHSIEDGRIDVHSLTWRGLQFVGKGRPCVVVDQPIPETVALALAGRPLSDAVSHLAVARAGPLRIVQADTNATFTTFILEDVHDFARRPPPGTDRRWIRVPFMPDPNE